MKRFFFFLSVIAITQQNFAQNNLAPLTVEKIMRDTKWIGTSPSNIYWSNDGKYLFFNWNPEKAISDSLYYITKENFRPAKADYQIKQTILSFNNVTYNHARTAYTYSKDGDIFFADVKSGKVKRITQTSDYESNPFFSFSETKIVYTKNQNLFAWDIETGETIQLSNFQKGDAPAQENVSQNPRRRQTKAADEKKENLNAQEKWLENDQLQLFDVLKQRKQKKDLSDSIKRLAPKEKEL